MAEVIYQNQTQSHKINDDVDRLNFLKFLTILCDGQ